MGSASEPGPALAIATCAELSDLDDENRLLIARLAAAGIRSEGVVWDDPAADWDRWDRVLLRTTWDYPAKPDRFADWIDERGPQLINPAPLVRWNLSKRYLQEVEGWGFGIVPTEFAGPHEPAPELPDGEFVIKPAISAGSKDTARYGPDAADRTRAAAHLRALLAGGREAMIQPYLPTVDSEAETAAIVLGGRFSHAIRKGPLLKRGEGLEAGLFRAEEIEPRDASAEEIALAEALVARAAAEVGRPLYARVDLLRSPGGDPLVLELELIEPSLFLDHDPPAADRLTALLSDELGR